MKHLKRFAAGLIVVGIFGAIVGGVFCFDFIMRCPSFKIPFLVLCSLYLIYFIGYVARAIKFNYGDEA